ncbi:MAG: hypothetical protein R3C45_21710 [Phycisphaerales bacterium]
MRPSATVIAIDPDRSSATTIASEFAVFLPKFHRNGQQRVDQGFEKYPPGPNDDCPPVMNSPVPASPTSARAVRRADGQVRCGDVFDD